MQFFDLLYDTFTSKFDINSYTLIIPHAFKSLRAKNENFEITKSSILQPLKLFRQHNVVIESHAVIFVNTMCNDLSWKNWQANRDIANSLLTDVFQINDIKIFENYSKDDMIEELIKLENLAKGFDEYKQQGGEGV